MLEGIHRIGPRMGGVRTARRCYLRRLLFSRIRIRRFMRPHILVVAVLFSSFHRTATQLVRATLNTEATIDVGELNRRVDEALWHLEKSDPNAGEEKLRQVAREYPAFARAHFYLGVLSQRKGDPETAVGFYATALRTNAAHADLINNIGVVLTHLPPKSRVRVAKAHGLWPTTAEQHEALIIQHVDNFRAADLDVAVVDGLVESLFRKTLEIDSCHRWALNNLGLHLHSHGRDNEALPVFTGALDLYPRDSEINFNLGVTLQRLGMVQEAARHFVAALDANPMHAGAGLNLAALHHRYGETSEAVEHYRKVAEIIDPDEIDMIIMLRNNLGAALFQMGEHTLAKVEHQTILSLLEARENVPPLPLEEHVQYDVYVDTLVNLHRARKASCDWRDWETHVFELKQQVDAKQLGRGHPPSLLPFDCLLLSHPVSPAWRRQIAEAHSARYMTKASTKAITYGQGVESKRLYEGRTLQEGKPGVRMEDGDTGPPMTLDTGDDCGDGGDTTAEGKRGDEGRGLDLTIGFIGHDFDEHPTAHMVEGVFLWQKRFEENERVKSTGRKKGADKKPGSPADGVRSVDGSKRPTPRSCCSYLAYSYGGGRGKRNPKDENVTSSRARESIRSCATSFIDLYTAGHDESAARIRADGVDILVDLQGHTLGGRNEIAAARPARVQVGYLVFPGTSGASYIDYLISDRHVTPPEHARHYSESLVLLPRTYQANLYEGIVPGALATDQSDIAALRKLYGLPTDLSRAILANFNKIDKLDPESFALWMQIMRRVPGSILWLLDASAVEVERQAIRRRLRLEAESQGVDGRRIFWAKRESKKEHLLRHAAADLFLDTLTYGAHSTASDALVGGLPFLTLAGESFASRVGVSLLRNVDPAQRALVVSSQREYEDLAVTLLSTARGRKLLGKLRKSLNSGGTYRWESRSEERGGNSADVEKENRVPDKVMKLPLFDTERITEDLNRAFMLMSDVYNMWRDRQWEGLAQEGTRLPHIILAGEKPRGWLDGVENFSWPNGVNSVDRTLDCSDKA